MQGIEKVQCGKYIVACVLKVELLKENYAPPPPQTVN